ncbi:hypothetical protein AVEN_190155-1 [Araneus ventricosus]|uniref:Uncharacterized protein n=1 Tax=Araneus ventricosus TaxID=182803 RepID=A0A4Y2JLX3_ARAVE|nr:hypothetical protein AVEN_190155-1 [Araneus ventricosus]
MDGHGTGNFLQCILCKKKKCVTSVELRFPIVKSHSSRTFFSMTIRRKYTTQHPFAHEHENTTWADRAVGVRTNCCNGFTDGHFGGKMDMGGDLLIVHIICMIVLDENTEPISFACQYYKGHRCQTKQRFFLFV